MMGYFVAAGVMIVALWGLLNPFVGLLGLLYLNTLQPGEMYPIFWGLHIERVVAILVLGSFLLHKGRVQFPPLTKRMLLLFGVMLLTIPFSIWRTGSLERCLNFAPTIIYHMLIVNLVTTSKQLRQFLMVFSLLIGIAALMALTTYQSGGVFYGSRELDRAVGTTSNFDNPNTLGFTMIFGLPLVLAASAGGSLPSRILCLAIALASVSATVLTGSRAAFFTMIFMAAVAALFYKNKLLYVPVVVVGLAVLWWLTPPEYKERYLSVQDYEHDASYQLRVKSRQAGWAMFFDHPILGVGIGQFGTASGTQYWPGPGRMMWYNAHNLYLQVLGELGIAGAIAFGLFLAMLVQTTRSLQKQLGAMPHAPPWIRYFPVATLVIVAGLLLSGWTAHSLYRETWYFLAALVAALPGIIEREYAVKEPGVEAKANLVAENNEVVAPLHRRRAPAAGTG